ncbi:MAG: hypothetical protein Kow0068_04980 [Marinilabiliales bacterium]
MKIFLNTILFILISGLLFNLEAQNFKGLAAYDNTWSNSSGILIISDTAVYEYSWYFDEWLPFPNNGLVRVNNIPQIDAIACFNNETGNPSGIYVISDTAVFVYNYYTGWIPLSNNGLCRNNGIPVINDLTCYKESSTGTNRILVISDTLVFQYEWYSQTWYPLSNQGLYSNKINGNNQHEIIFTSYPVPASDISTIHYVLPENFNSRVQIALFSDDGKFLKLIIDEIQTTGEYNYDISTYGLKPGNYFYQINSSDFKKASHLVVVK